MKEYKDIIESGMLERYLMGELSKGDMESVEHALASSPELREQFDLMEAALEAVAMENAITPSGNVKQAIFRQLAEDPEQKVIPIKRRPRGRTLTAVAASLAVLFLLSSFWLYQKMDGIEDDLRLVEEQNSLLQNENRKLVDNYSEIIKRFDAVNNAETEKLIMRGNELAPTARAISYVNHSNKTVLLNASGLPELDKDKDYQLWADVEGEMIDMGVIPRGADLAVMKYIDNAASFNITIEPAGGNDHPTVSQLISNVYLN